MNILIKLMSIVALIIAPHISVHKGHATDAHPSAHERMMDDSGKMGDQDGKMGGHDGKMGGEDGKLVDPARNQDAPGAPAESPDGQPAGEHASEPVGEAAPAGQPAGEGH